MFKDVSEAEEVCLFVDWDLVSRRQLVTGCWGRQLAKESVGQRHKELQLILHQLWHQDDAIKQVTMKKKTINNEWWKSTKCSKNQHYSQCLPAKVHSVHPAEVGWNHTRWWGISNIWNHVTFWHQQEEIHKWS